MKKYIVKLEFFGKYLKIEVYGNSKEDVINRIKNRINFHSIEEEKKEVNAEFIVDYFNSIFDGKI